MPHGNKFHHVKRLKINLQCVEATFSVLIHTILKDLKGEEIDYIRGFGVTNIEKIYIGAAQVGNLVELVKDRDSLVLANLLVAGGEDFIKTAHVTNESFETKCNEVDRPNKESTNKAGEGLNAPLGKEITFIDVGIDPGFEDIDKPKKNLTGKLGITTSQASASSKRSGKKKSHPTQEVQQSQSSEPSQAIVQSDSGNRKGANSAFKRPRVVGHGVFVSKDGFICAEQGRSISRVIKSEAQKKLISSAIVTGDLGYAPSKGLKWKGKSVITGRQLQHKSALLRQKNIKSQTSS
ncbi:hypothetical protein KY284_015167 [Solanum tuberosum]|nr:hypothetical protein KY284_015167 [Solanum tuberosum]